MKEIDKKDTPEVSGGYQPSDGGCLPVPIQLPGETGNYPQCPISPWAGPDVFVTDPPQV